ncbi:Phenolphthiocerol/phthiocerol polyketide synthase subunit C ((Phenol)carboxyphthiodiolenone synthase subunit C) (Beta-ketoacyl-acyl-carrier-protein synthase I) (Phthiocerol synthesis polyketide synthase type I PpsC) [Durusdinium trenchii]|uniref:Ketosynthase family 3 (KS3) domain-containing protein n=1 Tax=Durusdinium trenchii TaxID=1381693 RepID=A0ABP0LP85_9DINO
MAEEEAAKMESKELVQELLELPDATWPQGFDLQRQAEAMDILNSMCEALVARGYCLLQRPPQPARAEEARENAEKLQDVGWLRAETEEAYLGSENMTRIKELRLEETQAETDQEALEDPKEDPALEDTKSESSWFDPELYGSESEAEAVPEEPKLKRRNAPPDLAALKEFNQHLNSLAELLANSPSAFGSRAVYSQTGTILRVPHMAEGVSLVGRAGAMDERDKLMAEEFMMWVVARRLCLFYKVEGQGILELKPKNPEAASPGRLLLKAGSVALFRSDLLDYRYLPDSDECLVLQTWLMDKLEPLHFRKLPKCPGDQGCDRVHVKSMTERFPAGAENCDMSFALFTAGSDTLLEPPFTRFDKDLYWAPDRDAPLRGLAYIIHGSFVEEDQLIGFDNDFFGIDIEEAQALAPSQRWVMEVGYEVLWKAGWTKPTLRGQRIGSFLGDSGSEWNFIYLKRDRYAISNNTGWVTCSRLGHTLGLTGPNVTVDTACSASLVATNAAAHMMVRRNTRIGEKIAPLSEDNMKDQAQLKYAVCMGVLVMLHPGGWIGECAATMLSYKGRAFTFDVGADGFIRGEGCCAVHLAAENDGERAAGERSLAVLLGSCANQDGRSASLTAPHGPSQQMCIRASLAEAKLEPGEVQVGECHGTGTALGDPIEIGAMKSVQFNKRSNPLLHASAKSNVGHEEANAGTCGFIKVCMLLNGGVSTPNPHLTALNPHLDTNAYPVMFTNELTCTARRDMCAGVSSFGFGGTNSRADLWADVEKGPYKDGTQMELTPSEGAKWIKRLLDSETTGSQYQVVQQLGVQHKKGH